MIIISQEELREAYQQYLDKGKQNYVAEVTGINRSILSKFKNKKFDLYPYLSEKLEAFLAENAH